MIEETVIRFNSNVASLEAVPTSEKMMSSSRVSRQEADLFAHSRLYMVELARGSSHIASTLTQSSQMAAIEEVLANFRDVYGVTNLRLFIELLARALQERHSPAAAAVRLLEVHRQRSAAHIEQTST